MIDCYNDFVKVIKETGFLLSGDNGEGIFSISDLYSDVIQHHTGDSEHDPWAWRIRVVREQSDMIYGKVFLKKGGYITKSWLIPFMAVRRKGLSAQSYYLEGHMSHLEKQVYDYINEQERASVVELRNNFNDKKALDKALVNLQMALFITISDETLKISNEGQPYGWPVTVFSTLEHIYNDTFDEAKELNCDEAYGMIENHIRKLNPKATDKKISRFIKKGF